ncbi:aldo/keto reductase [Aestuariimicrobium ganziense]|uniref:aldo/keto reductase n=1 Tax=Aestuariimicrobium ganziense TaxID=2773677 RepID=UPI0019454E8E|nr:aldo/keto reductase [Aestuariimicrobium ganziense]
MAALGLAAMPWSPLARGKLTRAWDAETTRSGTDEMQGGLYDESSDKAIVEAVAAIADARGVSRAQVALAWVMKNPVVVAPLVGMTKPHHLTDAVAALDLELTEDEITRLESPYSPRAHLMSQM